MFKILITTVCGTIYGSSVHALVVEFPDVTSANAAFDIVNDGGNTKMGTHITRRVEKLYQ